MKLRYKLILINLMNERLNNRSMNFAVKTKPNYITIYYDQGSDIKAKQCKTIVTFETIPESKILDTGDLLILSNLQKP